MNLSFDIFSDRLIFAIGWTLIHSIWQGLLVGMALAGFLLIFREQTAKFKYNISLLMLFLFLVFSMTTFIHLYQQYNYPAGNTVSSPVTATTLFSQASPGNNIITNPQMAGFYLNILQHNMPFIVLFWGLGVIILSLRFTGGLYYTQRLKHYQTNDITHIWDQRLKKLCKKINFNKRFNLFESTKIQIPVVIGVFKPVILIPAGALTGLPASQIDAILAHELAHIYRRDFLVNIFQSVINVVYFYHPVVWWMSSTIRSERENCCDDIALAITGDKLTVARALTTIYEHNIKVPTMAMAAMNNKFHLFKRIKRLTNTRSMDMNPINGFLAACLFIIGLLILFVNASAHMKVDQKDLNSRTMSTQSEFIILTDTGNLGDDSRNLFAENIQPDESRANSGSSPSVSSVDSDHSTAEPDPQHDTDINDNEEDFSFTVPMPVFNFSFADSIHIPEIDIDIDEEQIIQSLKIAETVLSGLDSSFFEQLDFQFDSLTIPNFDSAFTVHFDSNAFKDVFINFENFKFEFDTTNFNKAMQRLQNLEINIDTVALKNLEQFKFNFDSTQFKEAIDKLENIHIELDTAKLAQIEKQLENIHVELDTIKLKKTMEKLEKERIKFDKVHKKIMEEMEEELAQKRKELDKVARELEGLQREKMERAEEKRQRELEKQHEKLEKLHHSVEED